MFVGMLMVCERVTLLFSEKSRAEEGRDGVRIWKELRPSENPSRMYEEEVRESIGTPYKQCSFADNWRNDSVAAGFWEVVPACLNKLDEARKASMLA